MTQVSIADALRAAVTHHQAGRLREAESLYRRILQQHPNHADSLDLLGVLAIQTGQAQTALALISRAIQINPSSAAYHSNLGMALCDLKRYDEAAAAIGVAIQRDPNNAEYHNNLGSAHMSARRYDAAATSFRTAIRIRPDFALPRMNLGDVFRLTGKLDEAIAAYRAGIQLQSGKADAHVKLAGLLAQTGQFDAAIVEYKQALALNPDQPAAQFNLAIVQMRTERYADAAQSCVALTAKNPDVAAGHHLLGNALRRLGQLDESIAELETAVRLNAKEAGAHVDLGLAFRQVGRLDAAQQAFQTAVQYAPDLAVAHLLLGQMLLLHGRYEEGWPELDWRLKIKTPYVPTFTQPVWDGSPLEGKRILLYAEEGMGDAMQFVRYASQVAQRGGKVIVRCAPVLQRLLDRMPDVTQTVTPDQAVPEFEVQAALMSLPGIFKTTFKTIPHQVPYLSVEPEWKAAWKKRVSAIKTKMKVGLVWAGRPEHPEEARRSIPISALAPLGEIANAHFFSLQKGVAAAQAGEAGGGMKVTDWTADLDDFADTAALISHLDVVLTVDTAVAHLAGAMKKRTWVLLPKVPDWRWLLDRPESAWYPTMRLYRQEQMGDWTAPVAAVAEALKKLAGG